MKRLLLLCVCAATLIGCQYFPESSFELAPDSRLPRWFTLPEGMLRKDVSVTMSYYMKPTGRSAVFILHDATKKELATVGGTPRGTATLTLKNPPLGSPPGYPSYEVVTANGIVEIIEHRRMEPLFWVTDDAAVTSELNVPANK